MHAHVLTGDLSACVNMLTFSSFFTPGPLITSRWQCKEDINIPQAPQTGSQTTLGVIPDRTQPVDMQFPAHTGSTTAGH